MQLETIFSCFLKQKPQNIREMRRDSIYGLYPHLGGAKNLVFF